MDALIPPLVAAFLAEWGDRTQILAMLLAIRFRGSPAVLIGIALAALANGLASAFAGSLVSPYINFRAITLMTALALLSAGAGALWRQKPPELAPGPGGNAFLVSFAAFAVLEFGDKTQFLTMTLAARSQSVIMTGIGAAIGIALASAPAILLGNRLTDVLPVRAIRIGAGVIFLCVGVIAAIKALQLV